MAGKCLGYVSSRHMARCRSSRLASWHSPCAPCHSPRAFRTPRIMIPGRALPVPRRSPCCYSRVLFAPRFARANCVPPAGSRRAWRIAEVLPLLSRVARCSPRARVARHALWLCSPCSRSGCANARAGCVLCAAQRVQRSIVRIRTCCGAEGRSHPRFARAMSATQHAFRTRNECNAASAAQETFARASRKRSKCGATRVVRRSKPGAKRAPRKPPQSVSVFFVGPPRLRFRGAFRAIHVPRVVSTTSDTLRSPTNHVMMRTWTEPTHH